MHEGSLWDRRNHSEKELANPTTANKPFVYPISEIFREPDLKPEYLCSPILEKETIGFIAGEPKVTKSWLALHIIHGLTTGNPILDKFEVTEKKKVLYVQEEDSLPLAQVPPLSVLAFTDEPALQIGLQSVLTETLGFGIAGVCPAAAQFAGAARQSRGWRELEMPAELED